MDSSNQAHTSARTGAHRAHGRTPSDGEPPPAFRHEPYLDGLFTYCLSVLCDHDTATDVLGDVLAVAERNPGRCPDEGDLRAWLYALARWGCLHRLAEQRRARQGAHSARRAPEHTGPGRAPGGVRSGPGTGPDTGRATEAHRTLDVSAYRRTELARLAWPEAAGTTPEQREALELAVRHRLGVTELASVLGTPAATARELLSGAACEVERTRAALAVVETGSCPTVSRLTGDGQVLLSTTLRAELVRHVDDCPRCRRVAERVGAAAPWPGSGGINTAALPLVPAPRTAVHAAMLRSGRRRRPAPRFDRTGFPMDPKDRAARRDRLRARAVTTTVVATVVAAPVLALWAAYRGAPSTGEPVGSDTTRISASESDLPLPPHVSGRPLTAYENTGNAATTTGGPGFAPGSADPDVSVEVISAGPPATADGAGPGAPGRLTVAASSHGATTVLTLTASGGAPVDWRLWSDAPWLRASRTAGTLAPGESVTLLINVDPEAQPVGAWRARVGVDPGGAVVSIQGRGRPAPTTEQPSPSTSPSPPTPDPTPTPTLEPPSPTPTATPTPTPTESATPAPSSSSDGTVSPEPGPSAPSP
ncbi:hypothetical protein ACGFYU_08040 [Streptomyces sp. NPDC048337]|uniref:BACON domain-containing protein n=1 Tax=Streptomyces sp. NPDC048337 TaxID=3365535 RepID=UPI00371A41BF